MSLESAMKLAKDLGLPGHEHDGEDGEGAFLAEDYGMGDKPPAEVRDLGVIEAEILFYKRQAGESILEIGRRLNEAKEQLGHGQWLPWLREKVDISERSAQNFMRLAKEYSKSAEIADLGASKALALLALSDSDRQEFLAEKHEVGGVEKSVADMTNKELKQAIEDRDKALRETESARAETRAAEEARDKMAVDMAHLKELAQRAQEAESQKQAQLNNAKLELEALKNKPVEVAVQEKDASPEQIAKAKAEAKAEAEKEIREAKAKAEQAEKELARARDRAKEANERALKAQEDKAAAEKKARDAEKMAKANGSEDMVRFKVLFENVQQLVNDMADVMETAAVENKMKMEKALGALADQISKVAGQ